MLPCGFAQGLPEKAPDCVSPQLDKPQLCPACAGACFHSLLPLHAVIICCLSSTQSTRHKCTSVADTSVTRQLLSFQKLRQASNLMTAPFGLFSSDLNGLSLTFIAHSLWASM